jgi:hypothetical protein
MKPDQAARSSGESLNHSFSCVARTTISGTLPELYVQL